jgi:hypothetical protein
VGRANLPAAAFRRLFWTRRELSHRARRLKACHWSFYIFSSGGSANELGIVNFDLEFLEKFGVLRHFLA